MRRPGSSYLRPILFLLGVTLVVALVVRIGPRAIHQQLAYLGPEVLWMVVPYAVGTTLGSIPWAWLLPPRTRPSWGAVIAGRFAASGANALLPFFGLAGEPSRLLWLAPAARPAGLAAVVVDRVLYNVANGLFLLTGSLAALATTALAPTLGALAAGMATVIVVATLALGWAVARFGVGARLHRVLVRMFGATYSAPDFGPRVDAAISSTVRGPRGLLFKCLGQHYVSRVTLGLEIFVALRVLDAPVGLTGALVLATVPVATSLVASSIPSQLGVQEAAMTYVCAALGLDPATGFTVVLLTRMRQLLVAPLTPVLLGMARPAGAASSPSSTAGLDPADG